jgi:hypothetical protein
MPRDLGQDPNEFMDDYAEDDVLTEDELILLDLSIQDDEEDDYR